MCLFACNSLAVQGRISSMEDSVRLLTASMVQMVTSIRVASSSSSAEVVTSPGVSSAAVDSSGAHDAGLKSSPVPEALGGPKSALAPGAHDGGPKSSPVQQAHDGHKAPSLLGAGSGLGAPPSLGVPPVAAASLPPVPKLEKGTSKGGKGKGAPPKTPSIARSLIVAKAAVVAKNLSVPKPTSRPKPAAVETKTEDVAETAVAKAKAASSHQDTPAHASITTKQER